MWKIHKADRTIIHLAYKSLTDPKTAGVLTDARPLGGVWNYTNR